MSKKKRTHFAGGGDPMGVPLSDLAKHVDDLKYDRTLVSLPRGQQRTELHDVAERAGKELLTALFKMGHSKFEAATQYHLEGPGNIQYVLEYKLDVEATLKAPEESGV